MAISLLMSAEQTDIFCGLPLSTCKNRVELFLTNKAQVLWNNEHKIKEANCLFGNQVQTVTVVKI